MQKHHFTYWQNIWKQFCKRPLGVLALFVVSCFIIIGVYAPFLASSKPLLIYFEEQWFFPLFRYLFYPGFFTKRLDVFYNLFMFYLPPFILCAYLLPSDSKIKRRVFLVLTLSFLSFFVYLIVYPPFNPDFSPQWNDYKSNQFKKFLQEKKNSSLFAKPFFIDWNTEVNLLSPYARLNLVLRYQQAQLQHERLKNYEEVYQERMESKNFSDPLFPSLWNLNHSQEQQEIANLEESSQQLVKTYPEAKNLISDFQKKCVNEQECRDLAKLSVEEKSRLEEAKSIIDEYELGQARIKYLSDRRNWLETNFQNLKYQIMPPISIFHWEEDAGGDQTLNRLVSWMDLTRINRKDLVSALIFGIRISLSVGLLAIGLALCIGIPVGAFSGYYGGKLDLVTYRFIEIWESMPTFFMLLIVVGILQSKSIFLVILVIGLFGWTGFSRFIRGEFLRQKQLTYVEACLALGYSHLRIIFSHLLPNAIPPLLTLIPFAITAAITSEAGLSFLGLGEEGSNSWGVLMDEGRTAFPSESDLLWPPAILLTLLLVSIALVGDSLRDALDPKLNKV